MTEYKPVFRSPIATLDSSARTMTTGDQNLSLSDLTGIPVCLIEGDAGDVLQQQFKQIPEKPGDLVEVGGGLLARLTATEFYLFGKTTASELPAANALDDSFIKAGRFAHATDYTHRTAALYLVGVDVPELLSKICGLDFHDSVFPNMRVAQSSAAKIKTLIARYDDGENPAYFLHVTRPFGQYFWEIVWDAGEEFGIAAVNSKP